MENLKLENGYLNPKNHYLDEDEKKNLRAMDYADRESVDDT